MKAARILGFYPRIPICRGARPIRRFITTFTKRISQPGFSRGSIRAIPPRYQATLRVASSNPDDPVVCQNSAERDPKRNRRLAPQPEPPRSAELSPFALDRGRMGWLHRRSSEVGGACKDFPARRDELPAPAHRDWRHLSDRVQKRIRLRSARLRRFKTASACSESADA